MPLNLDLEEIYDTSELCFIPFDSKDDEEIEEFDDELYQWYLKEYCKYTDINIDEVKNKKFNYLIDLIKYFSSEEIYERVKKKLDNQIEKYGIEFWVPKIKKAINKYNDKTVPISVVKIFTAMVKFLHKKLDTLFIWDTDIQSILDSDCDEFIDSVTEPFHMKLFIRILLKI